MAREREAEALVIDLMANDPIVVAAELQRTSQSCRTTTSEGLPVVDSRACDTGGRPTDLSTRGPVIRARTAVLARDVMTQPRFRFCVAADRS